MRECSLRRSLHCFVLCQLAMGQALSRRHSLHWYNPRSALRESEHASSSPGQAEASAVSEEEERAARFLQAYNEGLRVCDNEEAEANWAYLTNISKEASNKESEVMGKSGMWEVQQQNIAKERFHLVNKYRNTTLSAHILGIMGATPLRADSEEEGRELAELENKMSTIMNTAKVNLNGQVLDMDPGLTKLFTESRDWNTLLSAWVKYRQETGRKIRPFYFRVIQLQNKEAHNAGYSDYGEYTRIGDFDSADVRPLAADLLRQFLPMYQELHAYVRHKLLGVYRHKGMRSYGPIPAHILGNMWAQSWSNLAKDISPFPHINPPDITKEMKKQGYTVKKMFRTAEDFYTSLGFQPMTKLFWQKSMFVRPPPPTEVDCHASAEDMKSKGDFRIKMCTEVTAEDLQTIHHEMGHVQYFMNYENLATMFREGANAAFHEAIGDTMSLSFISPGHLKKIGLLNSENGTPVEREITFLFYQALTKMPVLPFAYVVDRWRWDVYNGSIKEHDLNKMWWKYREMFQGVGPPVERSEEDLDSAAKYHVADNVPYMRYFFSHVAQFQFHKILCDEMNFKGPLYKCDIYKSSIAGKKLRDMMSLGASIPWKEVMEKFTGTTNFEISAIKEYFQPLIMWLHKYNRLNNIQVGFD